MIRSLQSLAQSSSPTTKAMARFSDPSGCPAALFAFSVRTEFSNALLTVWQRVQPPGIIKAALTEFRGGEPIVDQIVQEILPYWRDFDPCRGCCAI
jgi:hypothetical protein